uniref:IS701 family transposase n=1 Tax=Streptomyces sp. SAT1 TaxID=1849967 RepID=UPI0007F9D4E7|nr:transposase [Streptomyces sp. SAT1]ANO42427.1 transposase [Streptomyces sp. SAT1]
MAVRYPSRTPALLEETPVAAFAGALFGHLTRADQRRWAHAYLEGLLSTPGKKSVRRLAAAVSASPTAGQSLQQFVNSSPWEWDPAREELTRWAEDRARPRAWTLGRAVLPKRGDRSVGVQRCFVAASGRTLNCQQAIGLFLATDSGHLPVDWHLLLPERWAGDQQLRRQARIPAAEEHRPLWEHALSLVDTAAARSRHAPVPAVADLSDCQEAGLLVRGLSRRRHGFVIAVPRRLPVEPHGPVAAPNPRTAPGPAVPQTAERVLWSRSVRRPHTAVVGSAAGRQRHVRIVSCLVRLDSAREEPLSARTFYRLFARWVPDQQRFDRMWLTNLVDHRIDELLALAALQAGTDATVTTLEEDFGLCDFEGRSFPGWHHHMTLVSAAYAYGRLGREED